MFHMRLGMERMQTARRRLGLIEPSAVLAQIVGTNGKGSTAFFLSQIAQAHGQRTGLFTSPHFLSFRERIRINGRCASTEQVLAWANQVQAHVWDMKLTYFELLTLVAMYGFCSSGLDLIVLEAGLGGKNDATSAWKPDAVLYTPMGLDHEQLIGPDLKFIARDKAGAIKIGSTAVTGPQEPQAMEVLQQEARRKKARVLTTDVLLRGYPEMNVLEPGLAGEHQIGNARLALSGWLELCAKRGWKVDEESCRKGLSASSWPGRLQRIVGPPEIILDGAHNVPALKILTHALEKLRIQPRAMVFNCMRDKDLEGMVRFVLRLTSGPIFVPQLPMYERARPAREAVAALGKSAQSVANVAEALHKALQAGEPVLICGSLYLLAEVYRQHPQWLEP
ncbi:MAG TPA: bifunctional folylpolyglutamate synthase/dihydrofolate synthase [Desulfonatronum sp.]|nr:bifunctional folylpolyglutamate synthase/dihydrofolate synthase [Desulfonatronum sp.]